jgi:transposase
MQTIGIDLGKVNSQVSERDEGGHEVKNVRLRTKTELVDYFLGRARTRILLESCTIVRWVARMLSDQGHEVNIADPNYLPMYVDHGSKRKKTDKRDASLLSQALYQGNWRKAHLRSEEKQVCKAVVDARSRLVRSRTKHINGARALLAQWGGFLPRCEPEQFEQKALPLLDALPEELRETAKIELQAIHQLTKAIGKLDKKLIQETKGNAVAQLLTTAPGIGPVTAISFLSTIDDPNRFENGHELASYLGLVPRETSSGEQRVLGRITKAGPSYLRSLLVQIAWSIWRSKESESARLKAWAERIAARRSKRIAIVALARKMAGVLLSMWKNKKAFDPNWPGQDPLAT